MSKTAYKNNKYQQQEQNNRLDEINDRDIQMRAYEIYQQKGGSEIDNWLEAEKALKEERRSSAK